MSVSKRIWIERDPAYEHVRQSYRDEMEEYYVEKSKQYTYRLAGKKFKDVDGKKRHDQYWNIALSNALRELDLDHTWIKEGVFFQTQEDLDQVKEHAERLQYDLELNVKKRRAKKAADPHVQNCPECCSGMKKRRARTGYHAGDEFWGCSRYPVCKGIRPIE